MTLLGPRDSDRLKAALQPLQQSARHHNRKKNGKSCVLIFHNNTYYFSMPLTSERFYPAPSGGADPDRYLILGFDTDRPEQRQDELFNHG